MPLPLSALLVGRTDWDLHDTCVEARRALRLSFGMRNINGKREKELKKINFTNNNFHVDLGDFSIVSFYFC